MTFKKIVRNWGRFFVDLEQQKKSVVNPEDYEIVQIPKERARKDALRMFGVSSVVYILILTFLHFSNSSNSLHEVLAFDAISAVIFLPLYLFFCHGAYKISKTFSYKTLSPIGERKKSEAESAARVRAQQQADWENEFFSKWYVRYPLALVFSCFLVWFIESTVEDGKEVLAWIIGVPFCLFIAFMVREVIGILILFGIGYLIYTGIAALPLSVAVVIGAIIIAVSLNKT